MIRNADGSTSFGPSRVDQISAMGGLVGYNAAMEKQKLEAELLRQQMEQQRQNTMLNAQKAMLANDAAKQELSDPWKDYSYEGLIANRSSPAYKWDAYDPSSGMSPVGPFNRAPSVDMPGIQMSIAEMPTAANWTKDQPRATNTIPAPLPPSNVAYRRVPQDDATLDRMAANTREAGSSYSNPRSENVGPLAVLKSLENEKANIEGNRLFKSKDPSGEQMRQRHATILTEIDPLRKQLLGGTNLPGAIPPPAPTGGAEKPTVEVGGKMDTIAGKPVDSATAARYAAARKAGDKKTMNEIRQALQVPSI